MNPSKHPRSRYSTSNNLPQAFLKRNSYAIQYESPTIQNLTLATNHLLETQIEDPTSTIQPRTTLYSDDQNIPKGAAQPSMTTPNDQNSWKYITHQKYRETLPSRQGYFRKHSSEAQRHSSSGWETDERQAARRRLKEDPLSDDPGTYDANRWRSNSIVLVTETLYSSR